VRIITAYCIAANPDLYKHSEFDATLTHWLHEPSSNPIFAKKSTREEWIRALGVYISAEHNYGDIIEDRIDKNIQSSFKILDNIPFPMPLKPTFRFADIFAGIGGFRIPLQEVGGKCVFSCEWDKSAKETYFSNFGEIPFGDIRQFTGQDVSDKECNKLIPDFDLLAAGFPCQPFSRAGVSARRALGQNDGFSCEIQGTLFFDLARIIKLKKPKVVFLENVKNLMSHDSGRTFHTIKTTIEEDLNYTFSSALIDSSPLVPQRRIRCYMVCLPKPMGKFEFPLISGPPMPLSSAMENDGLTAKYTISKRLWEGHQKRTVRNIARGTGFTAFLADINKPANTLVARYGKDGKECLIPQSNGIPRKLTPRECANLQGFPREFILPRSNAAAYRQFGNSVAVPVIRSIVEAIVKYL
jgi:DNA (cytosine-5)-methyltransferase 1